MVRVTMERRAKPGKGDELEEACLALRATALQQPGYISGETLRGYDDPSRVLVIGTWTSAEAWRQWEQSIARTKIADLTETLLEEEPRACIWAIAGKKG